MIEINKFVYLGVYIFFLLFLNKNDLIYSLCFSFPLLNGLPNNFILLAWIVVYLLKTREITPKTVLIFSFFFILELVSHFGEIEADAIQLFSYLSCLFVFFLLIANNKGFNFAKCIMFYFIGSFLFCLIVFLSTIKNAQTDWISLFQSGRFRFGTPYFEEESMHVRANANELGYYALVGISCGLILFRYKEIKFVWKIVIIAIILFEILMGFLSVSRSFVICLILVVGLLVFMKLKNKEYRFQVFALLLIIGLALAITYYQHKEIIDGIIARFEMEDTISGGGRAEIWNTYWDAFFENPKFVAIGTGVIGYREATNVTLNGIHNMFQQIVVCYGFPSALIFFAFMALPIVKAFRISKFDERWLPIMSVLMFTQTIQFLNPHYLMLHFIIGVFALLIQNESFDVKPKTILNKVQSLYE